MSCNEFNFEKNTEEDICTHVDIGKHFSFEISEESEDGSPTVFTGYTFNMDIKDTKGGTTLLSLTNVSDQVSTGFYIVPTENEVIEMIITDTDSGTFADGTYVYELRSTDTLSRTKLFMYGTIRFVEANI